MRGVSFFQNRSKEKNMPKCDIFFCELFYTVRLSFTSLFCLLWYQEQQYLMSKTRHKIFHKLNCKYEHRMFKAVVFNRRNCILSSE